ncbi:hypothetical protein L1887_62349 [Cichorium endivia]|nr:hypothetical protein L1887_62349 [Cichorium endivia]
MPSKSQEKARRVGPTLLSADPGALIPESAAFAPALAIDIRDLSIPSSSTATDQQHCGNHGGQRSSSLHPAVIRPTRRKYLVSSQAPHQRTVRRCLLANQPRGHGRGATGVDPPYLCAPTVARRHADERCARLARLPHRGAQRARAWRGHGPAVGHRGAAAHGQGGGGERLRRAGAHARAQAERGRQHGCLASRRAPQDQGGRPHLGQEYRRPFGLSSREGKVRLGAVGGLPLGPAEPCGPAQDCGGRAGAHARRARQCHRRLAYGQGEGDFVHPARCARRAGAGRCRSAASVACAVRGGRDRRGPRCEPAGQRGAGAGEGAHPRAQGVRQHAHPARRGRDGGAHRRRAAPHGRATAVPHRGLRRDHRGRRQAAQPLAYRVEPRVGGAVNDCQSMPC